MRVCVCVRGNMDPQKFFHERVNITSNGVQAARSCCINNTPFTNRKSRRANSPSCPLFGAQRVCPMPALFAYNIYDLRVGKLYTTFNTYIIRLLRVCGCIWFYDNDTNRSTESKKTKAMFVYNIFPLATASKNWSYFFAQNFFVSRPNRSQRR